MRCHVWLAVYNDKNILPAILSLGKEFKTDMSRLQKIKSVLCCFGRNMWNCMFSFPVFALVAVKLSFLCWGYNFDIQNSVRINGKTTGSYFGYSIGYYEYGNVRR